MQRDNSYATSKKRKQCRQGKNSKIKRARLYRERKRICQSLEPPFLLPKTLLPKALSPEALSPKALSPKTLLPKPLSLKALSPEALSPKALSPEALSPKALSPEALSPKALSPKALSPEALSPKALSPKALSPKALSPEALSPKALSPKALSPKALSPKALSPKALSPKALSPKALSLKVLSLKALLPEALSPKALSPEALSPEALSPKALSPEALSPEALSPEALSPKALSPEALSLKALSLKALSPEALSPEALLPEALLPEALSPEALLPEALSPKALSPEALSPKALLPEALLPEALSPEALLPEALSPKALSPKALSPEALSPEALSPKVLLLEALLPEALLPKALSPEALSPEALLPEALSPEALLPEALLLKALFLPTEILALPSLIETPIPGITIYRQCINKQTIQTIYEEWEANIPQFAHHHFCGKNGVNYSPRRSIVLRYNASSLYHYTKAVTYATIASDLYPKTSGSFLNICKKVGLVPDHAHVIIYTNGDDYIDWHTDEPIQIGSLVVALRVGCPRRVEIRGKFDKSFTSFVIYEGDVWTMTWESQKNYEHRVPKISENNLQLLLNDKPKTIFQQMGEFCSGAIIGRKPFVLSKKKSFTGLEQIFIPNPTLQDIAKSKPPKPIVIMGEIRIPVPANLKSDFGLYSFSNTDKIKTGSLYNREQLYNYWIHTHQRQSLVYDKHNRLAISILFGIYDEFGPCTRVWSTNNNKNYIESLIMSGYYSNPIRIIINTKFCLNALDIKNSKGKICWVENAKLKVDQLGSHYYMYVGVMYIASYFYKNKIMYFQIADEPPPSTWKETVFVKIAKELNLKLN